MTNRIVAVLAIILLLSFTPISALSTSLPEKITQKIAGYVRDFNFKNFVKGAKYGKKIHKYLKKLGLTPKNNPQTNELSGISCFFITFDVGVNKQPVIAKIDINNQETFINNFNYKPGCAYTTSSPIDPLACFRYHNNYISTVDVFTFSRLFSCNSRFLTQASPELNNKLSATGVLSKFLKFLTQASPVSNNNLSATGVLSFNRNRYNRFSIVNQFQYRGFSYYFPKNNPIGVASINFGLVDFNPTIYQSIPLLNNDNFYQVPPPQILVGNGRQPLPINPTTDFINGVIIDTSVPYIKLATNAYNQVVMELTFQIERQPVFTDPGIPLCFYNKPNDKLNWPIMTLLFQSQSPLLAPLLGYNAKMVLRKDNYVATVDPETGLECAMIYESKDISKIGTIAQYNRNMIFDVDGSRLYFDQ